MAVTGNSPVKIVLYCDESGHKGPSTEQERRPGEIGVYAGLLMDPPMAVRAAPKFQEIADRFKDRAAKLHIADLNAEDQVELRQAIFSLLLDLNIPCFWSAIHKQGFYDLYETQRTTILEALNRVADHRGKPRTKRLRGEAEVLLDTLFQSFAGRVIAFCAERGKEDLDLTIRMDRTEPHMREDFPDLVADLLRPLDEPKVVPAGDFQIITRVIAPPEWLQPPAKLHGFRIEEPPPGDGLVLAADVLAHSLFQHLGSKREASKLFAPLNGPEAIADHPLAPVLLTFHNWPDDDIDDLLHAHPQGRGNPEPSRE